MKKDKNSLKENLKKLEAIASWFEAQEEVDIEAGLQKVKEGAELLVQSKARLREIANEFEEIKERVPND